jgi:hypothetical protein
VQPFLLDIQKRAVQEQLYDYRQNFGGETMEIVDYNLIYDTEGIRDAFISPDSTTDEMTDAEFIRLGLFINFEKIYTIRYGIIDEPVFIGGTEYKTESLNIKAVVNESVKIPKIIDVDVVKTVMKIQSEFEKAVDIKNLDSVILVKLEYFEFYNSFLFEYIPIYKD